MGVTNVRIVSQSGSIHRVADRVYINSGVIQQKCKEKKLLVEGYVPNKMMFVCC
jgi:hypothetical protein